MDLCKHYNNVSVDIVIKHILIFAFLQIFFVLRTIFIHKNIGVFFRNSSNSLQNSS